MTTEILEGTEENIKKVAKEINAGEIAAFPTETVYGLGGDALNSCAVKKIFQVKGRPQDNPLIVHIANISEINKIGVSIPNYAYLLAEKFMPGPLTLVLKKSKEVPDVVTAGGDTVAVRIPEHKIARRLIELSAPLAAPSANVSKHVSPTTAQHVYNDLNGKIKYILDGGDCTFGIESTVLDLTTEIPTILRPGAITAEMLCEVLGDVKAFNGEIKIAKSPGMKYKHYSPEVDAVLASDSQHAVKEYVEKKDLNPVIIGLDSYLKSCEVESKISLGKTAEEYMKNIYSSLRYAEKKYGYIIIQMLSEKGIEQSIMNRVKKAVNGKII